MHACVTIWKRVNALRPKQNGFHFADDIFYVIFFDENCRVLIKNSLKFVLIGEMFKPALV